jgi:hypothetical protein
MTAASAPPGPALYELHVDRLALSVAGLDEAAARRLAQLVAEGLAAFGPRLRGPARIDALGVEVDAADLEAPPPQLLAERVVEAIARALESRSAAGETSQETIR